MKNKINVSNTIKDQAHDKAFANIHICELDIRRLKEEIKADITPYITAEQNEGVLRLAKKELKVWNYITKLIELDYGKTNYFST